MTPPKIAINIENCAKLPRQFEKLSSEMAKAIIKMYLNKEMTMPIKIGAKTAPKVPTAKATATVSKSVSDKKQVLSEDTAEEKVEVPQDVAKGSTTAQQLCEVGIDVGFTKNLGNYQSSRVGVSLKIPCQHAEIDKVFEYAQSWVDTKMQELMADE